MLMHYSARRVSGVMLLAIAVLGLGRSAVRPTDADKGTVNATLRVGFGESDVTPKVDDKAKPVFIAGFGRNRKATGVHDPLKTRTIVLEDGDTKIALVSVDVVGLFHDVVERVRKRL